MPLLSRLGFARNALDVRYRATRIPQRVLLHANGPSLIDFAPVVVRRLVDIVNAGGAGGIEHECSEGAATLEGEEIQGDSGNWVLRMGGVSPVFIRVMVEHMRMASGAHDIQALSLRGELELDDGPLSVDVNRVRTWLDDARAYPRTWCHKEFPVSLPERDEVTLRVRCVGVIDAPIRDELETLVTLWINAVAHIIGDDDREVDLARRNVFPAVGRAKYEMRALFPQFPHALGPACAVLSNMLLRFHRERARLAEVELGAPW